jgi:hypothetical protein
MLETIYLEVDNVLTEDGRVRPYVKEFLRCVHSRFKVYFLTRLSHEHHHEVVEHFKAHTNDAELLVLVENIPLKPWEIVRADGIDRNEKHVWYNDGLFGEKEETYLLALGMGYGRKVAETPDFFAKEVAIFEQMF